MRLGETRGLCWSYIGRKAGLIRLSAAYTKEETKRSILINHHVKTALHIIIRQFNNDIVWQTAEP